MANIRVSIKESPKSGLTILNKINAIGVVKKITNQITFWHI